MIDQFVQDIRYALRAMIASPLFTAMAVLSLALGIGANTAIYSFLDAILLRSLPVVRPQELVVLEWGSTARYNSIKEKTTPPLAYLPYTQDLAGLGGMFFQLRVAGDPLALTPAIRRIVHEVNANVPVAQVNTQTAQIDRMIRQERTFGQLCSSFAVLALTIASIGLYGAMAYMVARRTSEIGIRMALGAERRSIVAMVLREVLLALVVAGGAIGLGLAW